MSTDATELATSRKSSPMKHMLGWSLSTLAIMTFSFGQASAAASQVVTAKGASVTSTKAATAPAANGATDKTKVPHYLRPPPAASGQPRPPK
jgi:hypothetical protein